MFIVLEGIDGAGTTTQGKRLCAKLEKHGYKTHFTAEPSTGKIGKLLRFFLSGEETLDGRAMAMLFAADRLHHYEHEVKPALDKNQVVVCDRYKISSIAYQGAATGEHVLIKDLNSTVLDPDITIFVDVSIDVALQRLALHRATLEIYENRKFLESVLKGYQAVFKDEDTFLEHSINDFAVVDGDKSIETVEEQIHAVLETHLNL